MGGMTRIRDLLARDLDRGIEEVIKVDQHDEETVYREITEYVVTDRIRSQYREILTAIAEAPADPHEGIGVWISGFFGSGKSSFAKNLGYILANRKVLGQRASDLFCAQVGDSRIRQLVEFINLRIPTEVLMFDISKDRAAAKPSQPITEILYAVLLRELGYAEDFDVAEMEIELEAEGKLDEFARRCEERFGVPWRIAKKGAQKISRTSALLHEMDARTYPSPDSWAKTAATHPATITVAKFVDRVFGLMSRRRPGKALVFIVDEVGQYVAKSVDKIDEMRAIVEELGKEGKNRIKSSKAVAPVWVIVTSQEKLDEVIAALDSKKIELARMRDRFKYEIDMSPADIREVATKRVLAKKDEARPVLSEVYHRAEGLLNSACHLERTQRHTTVTEDDFIQFYPYLPHFIDLSLDIMSGIRLQSGSSKHHGGSARTIIKQAYEMLVSERTGMADRPVGSLVPLDLVFELVEGNLSTERQKDVTDVVRQFKDDPADGGWAARVAKAICLLENVRDLPRTEHNIAALLVDEVGKAAPLQQVQAALSRLVEAKFVRNTDDGYKLQTAQEKTWETERRSYLDPKPSERNAIKRDILRDVFDDPKFKTYRYKELRTFRVGITVDGTRVGEEGHLNINVVTAEDASEYQSALGTVRDESRAPSHQNDLYWVIALTDDMVDLIKNLHASSEMERKYEGMRSKNRITQVEAACLAEEKTRAGDFKRRLREKFVDAIAGGAGVFRGVVRDGSSLGRSASEALRVFLDTVVGDLYPKLEIGACQLKGTEAEEVLKAANLGALSQVFYGGEGGLNLIAREGGKFVPNPRAAVAAEVLNYLVNQQQYGIKVTGKTLEEHFQGIGYGWERDLIRLVLAVLLRAGAIEVTYEGRRYISHSDPLCRIPLINNNAFKAASFAPRKSIVPSTLTKAAGRYEEITGREVDIDEEAISEAFKTLAEGELRKVLEAEASAKVNDLPVASFISEYRHTLETILGSAPDERVMMLADEGRSFKEARDRAREIIVALTQGIAESVREARVALRQMWPEVRTRADNGDLLEGARQLEAAIEAEEFYKNRELIEEQSSQIAAAYQSLYRDLHEKRAAAFAAAIEEVKGYPEWGSLAEAMRESVLAPLAARSCSDLSLLPGGTVCSLCRATMSQMEADLAALPGLKAEVAARIQELTAPVNTTKRVRLREHFPPALDSEESVDRWVEEFREYLHKLIAEGFTIVLE